MAARIVVLGGGESGIGAALLAQSRGYEVFLSDAAELASGARLELEQAGIPYEEKGHSQGLFAGASLVMKSPGIPPIVPPIQRAQQLGLEVISEIEFASRHTDKPVIAVTGTNGKTTTTLLIHHLLESAGYRAGLGGNIGHSFARLLVEDRYTIYVLEVSSFQLEDCYRFRPKVGVLTHVTPDHLDRYQGSLEKYAAAKYRLFQNMGAGDAAILNADCPVTGRFQPPKPEVAVLRFSTKTQEGVEAWATQEGLLVKEGEQTRQYPREVLPLPGEHNRQNLLAALLAVAQVGKLFESNKAALPGFQNHAHRLEAVETVEGVRFINDSKATNVEAARFALESYDCPILWIAGGSDKGNDYSLLSEKTLQNVRGLVALGLDNSKLRKAFSGRLPLLGDTDRMEKAVSLAFEEAKPGDLVLLSPACASFDLFRNYQHRGELFKAAVQKLKKELENTEQ